MSNSKKSFVGGAAILAAAGLIGKVIGMFYRVWLTDLITSEGMGLYGTPYSVYNFLLVLSSAGLPTAISKMVSERLVSGDRAGAKLILKKTRRILLCTGHAATAIMASLSQPIGQGGLRLCTGQADGASGSDLRCCGRDSRRDDCGAAGTGLHDGALLYGAEKASAGRGAARADRAALLPHAVQHRHSRDHRRIDDAHRQPRGCVAGGQPPDAHRL